MGLRKTERLTLENLLYQLPLKVLALELGVIPDNGPLTGKAEKATMAFVRWLFEDFLIPFIRVFPQWLLIFRTTFMQRRRLLARTACTTTAMIFGQG